MKFNKVMMPLIAGILLSGAPILGNADVAQRYEASCAACHDTGALNAPKTGDTAVWAKLKAEKGMPALVQSVRNGGKQMPAGGLCNDCKSSADYAALIEFMSK